MSIKMIQATKKAKAQRGYSLIELSIAMAILSVIIVGSLVGVQRILANNRTNNVLQFVPRLNATLISGTLGGGGGTVINTALAGRLGAFDPTTITGAGDDISVRNEYGGTYNLVSNSSVVGNSAINGGYYIYITNVPRSVCPILANGLSAMTEGMWIGTAAQLAPPAANVAEGIALPAVAQRVEEPNAQFSVTAAATQCAIAATNTLVAFVPMT